MQAKNLPEMKRNSKSADAYVEFILLQLDPARYDSKDCITGLQRQLVDVDVGVEEGRYVVQGLHLAVDAVSHNSPGRKVRSSSVDGVRVVDFQRTSVQTSTRFPEWRETVTLHRCVPNPLLLLWVLKQL